MPEDYYSEKLSAERLRRVYVIATPRIRQYLNAEIDFVLDRINPGDTVIELGCGYGRVMAELSAKAGSLFGLDTSQASLKMAREFLIRFKNAFLICADAGRMPFRDNSFDVVVCIQNGISAFHIDRDKLVREAYRIARSGGVILFSSYAKEFWEDQLRWFELQAENGLLGEIDYVKTGNGVIVCKDGFTATTVGPDEFIRLTKNLRAEVTIEKVDGSSVFCIIRKAG